MVLLVEPRLATRFVRLPWGRVIMDKRGNRNTSIVCLVLVQVSLGVAILHFQGLVGLGVVSLGLCCSVVVPCALEGEWGRGCKL